MKTMSQFSTQQARQIYMKQTGKENFPNVALSTTKSGMKEIGLLTHHKNYWDCSNAHQHKATTPATSCLQVQEKGEVTENKVLQRESLTDLCCNTHTLT